MAKRFENPDGSCVDIEDGNSIPFGGGSLHSMDGFRLSVVSARGNKETTRLVDGKEVIVAVNTDIPKK